MGVRPTDKKTTRILVAHCAEHNAERCSHGCEHQALRQQLDGEPGRAGAEREAHGNLRPARCCASKEEVRDIRAGDQQHHAYGRHQDK